MEDKRLVKGAKENTRLDGKERRGRSIMRWIGHTVDLLVHLRSERRS